MRRIAALLVALLVAAAVPQAAAQTAAGDGMDGSKEGVVDTPRSRSTSEVIDDPAVTHEIVFPVDGEHSYTDTFGACRDGCSRYHEGIDIMAGKMTPIVAAAAGEVSWLKHEPDGNYVFITGDDGWQYWYIHLNNDTPGTDDGANRWEQAFAPGVELGARVEQGQLISWVGDSGNAEYTAPHLHFEMHRPDGSWGGQVVNPYYSLRLSQGQPVGEYCDFGSNPPPGTPSPTSAGGYWVLDDQGGVLSYGGADWHGGVDGTPNVTSMASTRAANGYWVAERGGRVTRFGDAVHYGDARNKTHPGIVNITRSYTGNGYWLLAANGRVFNYGDARQFGYPRGSRLTFVGMNRTATGNGYWLLASNGKVYGYGDARQFGNLVSGSRAVGMAPTASGNGYWIVAANGDVVAFGDAKDYGSPSRMGLCDPSTAVRIRRTASGSGYWVTMTNGDIHQFGDAYDFGDPNDPVFWHSPIVDMAIQPYR